MIESPTANPFLDVIARFSAEVLETAAAAIDAGEVSAAKHLPALREVGILGLNLPEELGGPALSAREIYEAIEIMAGACASTTSMLTAHYLSADAILLAGSPEQQRRFLLRVAEEGALLSFALTEPAAGSNPADMRTTAVIESGAYRLRGVKHFISNAADASLFVVFAKTDMHRGARGVSAFVAQKDALLDGSIDAGPHEPTMGLRGGHVHEVHFDCLIPVENRLGEEGSGFKAAMRALDRGRLDVAAQATGIARVALVKSTHYMRERKVGGRMLAEFQGLQWMLADMATELAAARALAIQAADLRDRGEAFTLQASMAKLYASEAASRIVDKSIQIHGGYGYSRSLPLERYLRDARIFQIYEGSSEIQRNVVARFLLQVDGASGTNREPE